MPQFEKLALPEVVLVTPEQHGDHRGRFSEVYNKRDFGAGGIAVDFVQDNHSVSAAKGTLRGLHYQLPPFPQAKLVRVARGRIFDVAVDIRRSSPRFGRHVAVELDAESGRQLFVPAGFAHGFVTLEPDCHVLYKVDAYYDRQSDRALIWNDRDLAIDWPLEDVPVLSDKDRAAPPLAAADLFD